MEEDKTFEQIQDMEVILLSPLELPQEKENEAPTEIIKPKKKKKVEKPQLRTGTVQSIRKATMVVAFEDGTGLIVAKRDGILVGEKIEV